MQIFLSGVQATNAKLPPCFAALDDDSKIEWKPGTGPNEATGAIGRVLSRPSVEALTKLANVRPRFAEELPPVKWHPLSDEVSVGWYADSAPPGPDMLRREKQLPGEWVTLGDGRDWLIPRAAQLPFCIGIGDGSELPEEIRRDYPAFVDKSYGALTAIASRENVTTKFTDADALSLALFALSVNYRVCPALADALGLFDSKNLLQVVGTITEASDALAISRGASTLRGATYRSWRAGLTPNYAPTVCDLFLLSHEAQEVTA